MNKTELNLYYENQMNLLKLIDRGDTSEILATGGPGEAFRELMKYELITLNNEKLELTDLGRAAMNEGVDTILNDLKGRSLEAALSTAIPGQGKKFKRKIVLLFLLMILALVIQQLIWR